MEWSFVRIWVAHCISFHSISIQLFPSSIRVASCFSLFLHLSFTLCLACLIFIEMHSCRGSWNSEENGKDNMRIKEGRPVRMLRTIFNSPALSLKCTRLYSCQISCNAQEFNKNEILFIQMRRHKTLQIQIFVPWYLRMMTFILHKTDNPTQKH